MSPACRLFPSADCFLMNQPLDEWCDPCRSGSAQRSREQRFEAAITNLLRAELNRSRRQEDRDRWTDAWMALLDVLWEGGAARDL